MTASAAQASVDQLIIKDCDGLVRATIESPAGQLSNVLVTLSGDMTNAISLKLSEPTLGTEKQKLAHGGKVTFEEIGSGEWSACPEDSNIQISDISIVQPNPSGSSSTVLAGVLGGGAVGALAILGSSDGGSSSASATTLSGSTGSSVLDSAAAARPAANSDSASRPIETADDCLNAERPDPLSPFL
ncbi:MAG: hypothetical protein K1X83_01395 [Oligoflexia bacterium]|nr:hypothetical protein [Oligoflexia bacterium]